MIRATIRCWPNGRVTQSFEREFADAPLEGDVLELTTAAEFVVTERRFSPDGRLHLRIQPTGDAAKWGTDALVTALEAAALGEKLRENQP